MKTVVLAGGKPKNISVLVPEKRSKHCLRILGKPVIAYPIEAVSKALKGSEILLVHTWDDVVEEARRYYHGYIKPVKQDPEVDTIEEALLTVEPDLRDIDYFLLVYGDIILDEKALSSLLEVYYRQEPEAAVLTIPLEERFASTYGVAVVDVAGNVERVIEKPLSRDVAELPAYTLGGAYILPTTILDLIKKEKSLPRALNMIAKTGKMVAVHWSGLWIDIGYPADLLEAATLLLNRLKDVKISSKAVVESNTVIKPPVVIDDKAYIDHGAVIKGPVYIGRESFIGAHSFVRHYASIEEKVRVGAYTEVKHSIIQPYTVIDSHSFIGDSIVGENTCIGSHVITQNVLPSQETPPRLREQLVYTLKPGSKYKLGAIIGYNTRISPGKILSPGQTINPCTIY